MKEISLGNEEFFELFIGKRVLKSEIFGSKENIPLYSANVFTPFGFVKKSNIKDFSCDYLLWGIDGKFEFNIIKKGNVFATTDHCGTIKIMNKNILPKYLLYQLELQSHILGYDRTLRPSLSLMKNVKVCLPITEKGYFDTRAQKEIIKKFSLLKEIKSEIKSEIEGLSEISLSIEVPEKYNMLLSIEEIFDLNKKTNSSKFTKSYVNEHPGKIPVYSASKNPDDVSYGFIKDNLKGVKYFENILTWNIDGSVGKAFFRTGRFSLSEKVIPLILKQKWEGLIEEKYVKYVLEKKAVEKGFTYANKAGKNKIKNIKIEIPYKIKDGKKIPDIEKQKELLKKYEDSYEIKNNLAEYLQELKETKVNF